MARQEDASDRLVKELFTNYNTDLIPRCNNTRVTAEVGMALRGILDVVSSLQVT